MQRAPRILVVEGREGILPPRRHGSEGKSARIIKDVADPFTGRKRAAVTLVQYGGIAAMHALGKLTDRQKDVAERFESVYETAHSDGVKGIDYSKGQGGLRQWW